MSRAYKSVEFAEMKASGVWRLVNAFAITGAVYTENGILKGEGISGVPSGQNLCSCFICGFSPLVFHFTIKNFKTQQEVNVGSECLHHLFGMKKVDAIKKGFESVRRKVDVDFKRKIYHKQLVELLKENIPKINESHNKFVDGLIKINSEHFWLPETEIVPKLDEKGRRLYYVCDLTGKKTDQIINESEAEAGNYRFVEDILTTKIIPESLRKFDARKKEENERNRWNSIVEKFDTNYWDPTEFRKNYSDELKFLGLEIPKMRQLTVPEQKERNDLIEQGLKEYLIKIKELESGNKVVV